MAISLVRIAFFCFYVSNLLIATPFDIDQVEPVNKDEEIILFWDSLEDLYNPTLQDYLKIQEYLKNGKRPYLDIIFEHTYFHGLLYFNPKSREFDRSQILSSRVLQNINLLGPDLEMPKFERLTLGNPSIENKSRCIILYASYNLDSMHRDQLFSERILQIINDLEEEGYEGDVLYRIGGYPLLHLGGIRLAHVPYSFKVLSFIEASLLGYEEVLWLDSSVHPSNNLSEVFSEISENGVFLLENGINLDYDYNFGILPDVAVSACGLKKRDLSEVPHVIAGIVGVSFKSQVGHDFIREWYCLTSLVYPAMSLYPEEFLVSVASYMTKCKSTGNIGNYMDVRSVIKTKPHNAKKPFWFDKS